MWIFLRYFFSSITFTLSLSFLCLYIFLSLPLSYIISGETNTMESPYIYLSLSFSPYISLSLYSSIYLFMSLYLFISHPALYLRRDIVDCPKIYISLSFSPCIPSLSLDVPYSLYLYLSPCLISPKGHCGLSQDICLRTQPLNAKQDPWKIKKEGMKSKEGKSSPNIPNTLSISRYIWDMVAKKVKKNKDICPRTQPLNTKQDPWKIKKRGYEK